MGILVGNHTLKDAKLGTQNVLAIYLGNVLLWPIKNPDDIDVEIETLLSVLSCISLGRWIDEFPWKDNLPWYDQ